MTLGYAFLRTTIQTRSKGHTATGAVCYRFGLAAASTFAGEDGTKRVFDYTRRSRHHRYRLGSSGGHG